MLHLDYNEIVRDVDSRILAILVPSGYYPTFRLISLEFGHLAFTVETIGVNDVPPTEISQRTVADGGVAASAEPWGNAGSRSGVW